MLSRYIPLALVTFLFLSASACTSERADRTKMNAHTVRHDPILDGQIYAPEFPKGLDWLNSDSALQISDFKGKFILLDFWTFCCINCMHVIPELKALEHKYADELVVIGVHSAKFTNEQGTANIRQAILRYGISHPVVNDKDFRIWDEYAVRAWPTLILINPLAYNLSV